ncbi:hypothetical protein Dtox_1979 [Desulfofarcimen acetoxidans DSM 771]|uniref:Dockerin domain-containing protein n=1 Tax=Desulfofarcimen acetoxidans (strain ATCC 49208 / DSM 771 / KCTC 5769 / VKM B-1644 / 5575) TaxID=485916 RepID=C8VYD3_DESAS|nr:leucine-rich repeat protein [Desulfofarcimen acetoxidans]ACV62814.1 hypothetical protein Dtox_1979 [Desulfofarcimen acetoxidans DSM 771]
MSRLLTGQSGRNVKKGISLLLALVMLLSLLPVQVIASEGEPELTATGINLSEGVIAGQPASVTAGVYNTGNANEDEFSGVLHIAEQETPYEEQTDSTDAISETGENNNEQNIAANVLKESGTEALELVSLSPANGATGVAVDAPLTLTFNRPVEANPDYSSGYLGIKVAIIQESDGDWYGGEANVLKFSTENPEQVTVDIADSAPYGGELKPGESYTVYIDNDCIRAKDTGETFKGIMGGAMDPDTDICWSFRTGEALSARINGGEAVGGNSLQAIVEAAEISPAEVTSVEVTRGAVSADDLAYIESSLINLETLTASYTVNINDGVLPAEAFIMHAALRTVNLPSVVSIGENAFGYCGNLKTVRLNNLRSMGDYAFTCCSSLDTLVVPNLQDVSDSAFSLCLSLEYVYMPKAVSMSGMTGFVLSGSLAGAWFPKLGNIAPYAFEGDTSFREMYLETAPFHYSEGLGGAFLDLPADRIVYVPEDYVAAYLGYADDDPEDGKWYGWTVKSFAESSTLGAFVEVLINQLPENDRLTYGDIPQVQSLRAAYNRLTAVQRESVSGAVYEKLTAAEATLLGQGNTIVEGIINRIDALPSTVTMEDKAEIRSIRQAYDNLPEMYRELITNLTALIAAEEVIAELDIKDVEQLIERLPSADELTLANEADVQAARSAYDALIAGQQASVSNYNVLLAAEDAIARLGFKSVEQLIEQLPSPDDLTLDNKSAVQAARNAYDALSAEQRVAVGNYELLQAAEAKIYDLEAQEAARAVDSLIDELPSAQEAQIADKTAALGARAAYNALNDQAKTYVAALQKLTDVLEAISGLERQTLKGGAVNDRISALPAVEALTLTDKAAVLEIRADYDALTEQEKALVTADNLSKLQEAEAKIARLESENPASSVTVTIEKFTLGQGFVRKPVQVSINAGENGAAVVTRLLGMGNYTNTGSIDSAFYLASIKDNGSAQADIPAYIIDAITAGEGTVGTRANANYLGEFDYYHTSGWMYTVNNILPNYGLSDYIPQDGDVFRLQFTLYGYGGDLGFGDNKLIDTADKGALIKKLAAIDASEDRLTMLADPVYKGYYDKALLVLQNLQASQIQVDAALADLNTAPNPPSSLGKVTVTVRDVVDRKWTTWNYHGGETTVEQLSGLGDYQESFGVLLEDVEVSITPGMTVRQAVAAALRSRGYQVTGTPTYIKGIGPVTSDDYTRTVAHLSENDAGSRSKWVMSQNDWCIWDTSQAYPVEDGDVLKLEYSVDGGIDIHCHPGSGSYLTVNFTIDGTTYDVSSSAGYYMVPAGTEEITVSAERLLRYAGKDIDRYLVVELQSEGVSVLNKPATFAVSDGQVIKAIIDDRYNSPNTDTNSGKTYTYTIEIKRTPAQVDAMIAAIPGLENIVYADKAQIEKVRRCYNYLTVGEKTGVAGLAVLEAAEARITAIYDVNRAEANRVIDLIKVLPNTMKNEVVTLEHRAAIEYARAQYEALTEDQKVLCSSWLGYMERAEAALAELLDAQQAVEGVPKDYSKDFLLSTMALNLSVGEEEEMVMFDTPRVGSDNCAYNLDDLILEYSGQEGVFEIEKRVVNKDGQDLTKYYVKGLSDGVGYFTVKYLGYSGQIPVIPVCVQASGSRSPALSTDIDEQVSKYDTMYFTEEEGSYPFTFTAESEDGASVSAMVYGVMYEPNAGGVFTVPLRDRYNPIIVTAAKDGQTTSIAYGIRAKVIALKITNESRGGNVFYQGDTVSIGCTGVMLPVPKVSRIYNPASSRLEYHTDMPRYDLVGSSSSQYAAGALTFELTGYGDIALTGGHVHLSWFGSGLYAETPIGGAPPNLNADQIANNFSSLPDIRLTVIRDPYYAPEDVLSAGMVGASTIHAGDEVTVSIPGIDTDMLKKNHTTNSGEIVDLLDSYTVFATDIPGLKQVKSVNVKTTDQLKNLKTITFTVPENTPSGDYKLKGGYIWVKYGPTWWTHEKEYYVTKMEDVDLTVTGETGAGDVNQDGKVDVQDMILVGQHFNERGAAGWISEDINKDGEIDVLDMIFIGQHWKD